VVTRASISSSVLHHECGIELTEKFYKALFSLLSFSHHGKSQLNKKWRYTGSRSAFFASTKWNKFVCEFSLSLSVSFSPPPPSVSLSHSRFLRDYFFLSFCFSLFVMVDRFLYFYKASSYHKNQSQNHISILRRS